MLLLFGSVRSSISHNVRLHLQWIFIFCFQVSEPKICTSSCLTNNFMKIQFFCSWRTSSGKCRIRNTGCLFAVKNYFSRIFLQLSWVSLHLKCKGVLLLEVLIFDHDYFCLLSFLSADWHKTWTLLKSSKSDICLILIILHPKLRQLISIPYEMEYKTYS